MSWPTGRDGGAFIERRYPPNGSALYKPDYRWSCTLVCIRIRSISAGEKRITEAPQLCDTSIYEGLRSYSSQIARQYRFCTPSRRWLPRPLLSGLAVIQTQSVLPT